MRFAVNPRALRTAYTTDEARVVSLSAAKAALSEMSGWSGYEIAPLWSLPKLAGQLGISALYCKDETQRLGLGSFKALGGAYAAGRALRRLDSAAGKPVLCCATDGNHGQSVASGARRLGCRCVIFVHEHAPATKIEAMRRLGGEVSVVAGNYDDSVRHAEQVAAREGWLLISDTSEDPYDPVAADVMSGYGVLCLEASGQLYERMPTHIFVQAGVGGLAAAVAGCFAEMHADQRPTVVVVEPEAAACVMASGIARKPIQIEGDLATRMEMLSCGQTSAPAWVILKHRADAFVTVSDMQADEAAATLRTNTDRVPSLNVSPSAAAGLAGLQAVLGSPAAADSVQLGAESRVLIIATEGLAR